MRERLADYGVVTSPVDRPLVFAGPPDALVGRVDLHNPGPQKVLLRSAGLDDPSGRYPSIAGRHSFAPVVLHPDTSRHLSLRLALDPSTPPGRYEVELTVAGEVRPAVLHVAEVFDLTVTPDVTIVENRPGEVQRKQVVVRNDGNVAFTVGEIGDVVLEDEMIWCRAERAAIGPWIEAADAGEARLEDLVIAVLSSARDEAYRSGNLHVHHAGGETEVAPGEVVTVELDVTVPERLHRNSRYRGVTPLFTEDLEFLVVPARGAFVRNDQPALVAAPATPPPARQPAAGKAPAKQATSAGRSRRPTGGGSR